MMRKFMAFAVLSPLVLQVVAMEPAMEDAICHGAMAKVSLRVLDDVGIPVTNTNVHVWFSSYGRPQDNADWYVATDTNGVVTVSHRTNEDLSWLVRKEGYYETHGRIQFRDRKTDSPKVKDGKWQPYGETRTVVLKKIRNPWGVKVFAGEQCHRKIPVFGQWIPFDMEVSDWLAPYGNGIHSDVLLRFGKTIVSGGGFAFSMNACFTNNPYAGFYCKPMDESSDLKTDYRADTNAIFCANYRFLYDVVNEGPAKKMGCGRDSYLVFRTRTRVDEDGKLIGAHYGKYCRGWSSNDKELQFGSSCFNPVENDTNIEGDTSLIYKIR